MLASRYRIVAYPCTLVPLFPWSHFPIPAGSFVWFARPLLQNLIIQSFNHTYNSYNRWYKTTTNAFGDFGLGLGIWGLGGFCSCSFEHEQEQGREWISCYFGINCRALLSLVLAVCTCLEFAWRLRVIRRQVVRCTLYFVRFRLSLYALQA